MTTTPYSSAVAGAQPAPAQSSPAPGPTQESPERPAWTLLSNHGNVLLAVAGSPDARVNEIATQVGITPRATLAILKDLEGAGFLTRHRVGRRTHYTINAHRPFWHPAAASHEVGELLTVFTPAPVDYAPHRTGPAAAHRGTGAETDAPTGVA